LASTQWVITCSGSFSLQCRTGRAHCNRDLSISSPSQQPAPLTNYRLVTRNPINRVYCCAKLAVSSSAVAETIASTHSTYPRRDGQAELAWMAGLNVSPTSVTTGLDAEYLRRCEHRRYHYGSVHSTRVHGPSSRRHFGHPSSPVVLVNGRLQVENNYDVTINKNSVVAEMGDRLATIDMGRKVGGGLLCPFPGGGGGWVPI